MQIDIFCMKCGTNYKGDFTNSRCPVCEWERRKKQINKIMLGIKRLPSHREEKEKKEEEK